MSKDATPGPDGLSRDNYVAAVDLLAEVVSLNGAPPILARKVEAFLRDRENFDLKTMARGEAPGELSEKEQKQWDAESVRTLKAVERARHELRHKAQVAHNTHIREGVTVAVEEWLASIFRVSDHDTPSFEDGTEVTLKLKAGQVATGEHGETIYQVQVKNQTKGVI